FVCDQPGLRRCEEELRIAAAAPVPYQPTEPLTRPRSGRRCRLGNVLVLLGGGGCLRLGVRNRCSYSITSSARPISGSGMVRPRALAVFRLMINSTLVACWTGRSAGFSPLRIWPV